MNRYGYRRATVGVSVFLSLTAAVAHAADVRVELRGLRATAGTVLVAIYRDEASWLKTPMSSLQLAAGEGAVTFRDLPPGEYAVSAFHDVNGNGRFDFGRTGPDAEAYGFSNDAVGTMGPARFVDAKVSVPASGSTVVVNLK